MWNKQTKKSSLQISLLILILIQDSAAIRQHRAIEEELCLSSLSMEHDKFYILSLQLESWILAGEDRGEILFAAANLTVH